ncbi:MAG: hypothetical protein GX795_00620 [Firmicutes bacterium]|nr:hypothetical protein [Bacillota bacterium]
MKSLWSYNYLSLMDTPAANREPRDFRLGEDPMEIKDNKVILRDFVKTEYPAFS